MPTLTNDGFSGALGMQPWAPPPAVAPAEVLAVLTREVEKRTVDEVLQRVDGGTWQPERILEAEHARGDDERVTLVEELELRIEVRDTEAWLAAEREWVEQEKDTEEVFAEEEQAVAELRAEDEDAEV